MPIIRPTDPAFANLPFPYPGAKLRFKEVTEFWFTDIIANGEKYLVVDQTYTLETIEVYSSKTIVTLVEFPGVEFSLGFFEYERRQRPVKAPATSS